MTNVFGLCNILILISRDCVLIPELYPWRSLVGTVKFTLLTSVIKRLGDGRVAMIRRTGCDRQAKAALSCLGS